MRLGHIELFAADPQVTADYYIRFFGCEPVVQQADGALVWIKSGEIELLIRPHGAAAEKATYLEGGPALVFYTSTLGEDRRRLAAAGVEQHGCDGQECCPLYRDPDGVWIQLVDPEHA